MAAYTRDDIIAAIQQATTDNGGEPVGFRRFETLTGITPGAWKGVYWARWTDAQRDAGLEPNTASPARDENEVLIQAAEMVRRFGRMPTEPELRLARRTDPTLPSLNAVRSFGGRRSGALVAKLRDLAESDPAYADIFDLLPEPAVGTEYDDQDAAPLPALPGVTGQVYLARMGKYYKIGMSCSVGRRIAELERHQPEPLTLIHTLQTDDPAGIERYWLKRFKDEGKQVTKEGKLLNGEWFSLSRDDVAAFKRRGRFM
jgi:hypothetical protein